MSQIDNTPLTFEKVWAALMENREQMKETDRKFQEDRAQMKEDRAQMKEAAQEVRELQKEAAQEIRELQKEAAREIKELAERQKQTDLQIEKTDRQMRETNRQIGELTNRFGELAEHLVAPSIHKRFNELGYSFNKVMPGGYKIFEDNKTKTEIDLLLQNGEIIMAVEVKATPAVKDVEHHIKRLEILRDSCHKDNDNRRIQGAIAGAIFGRTEKEATLEAGFYVIEQSGDTMKIEVPAGFTPREW
ncbi:MAG: hypothetical protein FWD87_10670, partial [Spirochaetaceae bacterium]|nr:hypothetical protein [Spirochaetaceae bacterium]